MAERPDPQPDYRRSYQNKIRRPNQDFDIDIALHREDFIDIKNPSLRQWTLNRAVDEFVSDLVHLDFVAKRSIHGSPRPQISTPWATASVNLTESRLTIAGQQVMQRWEEPLMKIMAEIATETHGDILEVGFGMGISATFIENVGAKSHTIVECNREMLRLAEVWRQSFSDRQINLVEGRWQDVAHQLGSFDAILFDTYPLDEDEFLKNVLQSSTFAECFFPTAIKLLRPGGTLTYYTNEIDSFSRRHQRAAFDHFRWISLAMVRDLHPPEDCNYWWADSMVAVKAIK